jgi:hypothetical protein
MNHATSFASRDAARRPVRVTALAFMAFITLLPLPAAPASDRTESSIAGPGTSPASPPVYQDSDHVSQGCYISTVVYLAKFLAAFPGEFGSPVTIHPKPYPTPHTIALVTWRNEWWLRDEFLGVIRLNLPVTTLEVTAHVTNHAEATLERRALHLSQNVRARIASFGARNGGGVDAFREISQAAKLLPFTSELFRIESRGQKIPLLFFRPRPGYIAVYNPVFGTATAETEVTSSIKVVELVAERLGYPVASVRPDHRHLVAAITP